jgi:hypothetical protein
MAEVLKEMFPQVEPEIIKALLEQCNGNTETAYELLVSMTSANPSKNGPIEINKNQGGNEANNITTKFHKIESSTNRVKDQILYLVISL